MYTHSRPPRTPPYGILLGSTVALPRRKHIRSNPIIIFQGGGGRKSPDINYIQTQTYSAASLHLYIYIIYSFFSILRYGIWLHFCTFICLQL